MTTKEKEDWLAINEDGTDSAIAEYDQRIEFIQPGYAEFIKKLPEEDVKLLYGSNENGEGRHFKASEIYDMFRAQKASNARRPSLILLKSFWQVSIDFEYTDHYSGIVINVGKGILSKGEGVTGKQKIILLEGLPTSYKGKIKFEVSSTTKIGFLIECNTGVINNEYFAKEIRKLGASPPDVLYDMLKGWNPSAYKSLLQKIIRYGSPRTNIIGTEYLSKDVLLVCLSQLAQHPGALVPDIQRFVTGLESVFKRVFVTIAEDSVFENENDALTLISCALLAQRVKKWVPSSKCIQILFKAGIYALESKKCYDYSFKEYKNVSPYTFPKNDILKKEWEVSSTIMDVLRSFAGDLWMVRNIAHMHLSGKVKTLTLGNPPPKERVFHLHQMVDQHWAPNIVYFYDPVKVDEFTKKSKNKEIYSLLFNDLWDKSSSLNPRRKPLVDIPLYIGDAQKKYLQAAFVLTPKKVIEKSENTVIFKYFLQESWLAALVGGIEIKTNPVTIVSIKPDDIYDFAAIRKPSRDTKDTLSDEISDKAIALAKIKFSEGVPLNSVNFPLSSTKLYGVLEDGEWIIKNENKKMKWEDVNTIVEVVGEESGGGGGVYTSSNPNITTNSKVKIEKIFSKHLTLFPKEGEIHIRKVRGILKMKKQFYEFPRVGREGGATKESVNKRDVHVFRLFINVANILPALIIPRKLNPTIFDFKQRSILWQLSEAPPLPSEEREVIFNTSLLYDKRGYRLKDYQRDALADMENSKHRGKFLWLATGSGKTYIVNNYMKNMMREINPKYIIYTLPAEAISTVGEELKNFGFEIDLVVPIVSTSGVYPPYMKVLKSCKEMSGGKITIIEHDYLRKCNDDLMDVAPHSLVIFDECHKLLNDTLRTGTALELSRASKHFVAMTGTPVVDNKLYKLVAWFEQIYEDIEITEKNFWVGANSMISKLVDTKVKVIEEEVESSFTEDEEKVYKTLVPPVMGGTNKYPHIQDFIKASDLCYTVCDRDLIKYTLENYKRGGVHLIAKNKQHARELYDTLSAKKSKFKVNDILLLVEKNESVVLTADKVEKKEVQPYKIVITPQSKSAGYDLAYLSTQIYSIYPSNQANRTQLRGRINRISQRSKSVTYIIVHCGILTRIMENHAKAGSLQAALSDLAKVREA